MTKDEAEKATILRCVVGSQAYGTSVDENSDRDEMGVLLEPLETILTEDTPKPFVYRDAAVREGNVNAKSKAGDLDLKLYGLKHFTKLALSGNPDVLLLLFTKPLRADARGMGLQQLKGSFLSQECIPKFKGYMMGQRQRLLGERGQKDVHRPDLVEKYGFDTKYAMQMIRLGLQAVELISTGHITLPMPEAAATICKNVRLGKLTEVQCVQLATELENVIESSKTITPLPEHPDRKKVWGWVGSTYLELWKCHAFDATIRQLVEQREGDGL